MKVAVAVLILASALPAMAQTVLKTSFEYPLEARIIAVEKRNSPYEDSGHPGANTYQWHLMKTVIGDKMFGLAATTGVLSGRTWLDVGTYPAKKVKHGFDVQYVDDKGRVQHEVLTIKSEEPAPAAK
jgi:hypothetical protein